MKKLFSAAILFLSMISALHAQSLLNLRMADNRPFAITIDGRYVNTFSNNHRIQALSAGRHSLQVFCGGGDMYHQIPRMVFNGFVDVPAYTEMWASVDERVGLVIQSQRPLNTGYNGYNYGGSLFTIPSPACIGNVQIGTSTGVYGTYDPYNAYGYGYNNYGSGSGYQYNSGNGYYYGDGSTPVNGGNYSGNYYNNNANNYSYNNNYYDPNANNYNYNNNYSNNYSGNNGAGNYSGNNYGNTTQYRSMSNVDFAQLKNTVAAQSFESTKESVARQGLNANYLTSAQIVDLLSVFGFESTKLEIAKAAYGRCVDRQNYYLVSNAFSFSSSVESLNTYINGYH